MRFDIRAQIVLLLMIATSSSLNTNIWIEVGIVFAMAILQLICGKDVFTPKLLVVYAVLIAIQYLLFPVMPEIAVMLLSIVVVNIRRFFPVVMVLAMIYRTTKVSQLTAAFTKMHIPKNAIIVVAIAIRYIPSISEEWRHIRDAMRVRRVTQGIRNPFTRVGKIIECYLAPFFMSAIKTSDELSAAAITRGIENPGEFTCRSYRTMNIFDYLLIIISIAMVVVCMALRYTV